jgi:hypothetical protein
MFIQKNENVFVLTERKNDVLDYIESSKINVQLVLQLANEYMTQFNNGIQHQPLWPLVRRSDVIRVWREFTRSGDVTENHAILKDMVDLTIENCHRVLANTYNIYEMRRRKSDTFFIRYSSYCDDRWTDGYYNVTYVLEDLIKVANRSSSNSESIMALDHAFNVFHSDDLHKMPEFFVQGGESTLDFVRDMR